jgi:hypothetical protein
MISGRVICHCEWSGVASRQTLAANMSKARRSLRCPDQRKPRGRTSRQYWLAEPDTGDHKIAERLGDRAFHRPVDRTILVGRGEGRRFVTSRLLPGWRRFRRASLALAVPLPRAQRSKNWKKDRYLHFQRITEDSRRCPIQSLSAADVAR